MKDIDEINGIIELEQIKLDRQFNQIEKTLEDVNQTAGTHRKAHVQKVEVLANMMLLNKLKGLINE